MIRGRTSGLFGIVALSLGTAACGSPGQGTETGTSASDNSGSATGGGSSGELGSGSGSSGNFAGSQNAGTGGTGGQLTEDSACAGIVMEPEAAQEQETIVTNLSCTGEAPSPIALYIVLDNSGSMDDNNKWGDAVDAISTFVDTDPASGSPWVCVDEDGNSAPPPADLPPPGSGSISVAIQYFHPQNAGWNVDECNGSSHATPAVQMGPLPANGGAIKASLSQTGPNGNTPTVGALTGGTEYCSSYQSMNPGVPCVVVLVTDGQPNGCGLSSDCGNNNGNDCVDPNAAGVLTPIASGAYTDPNSVMTFTVGMDGVTPEGFALLDAIAVAGGSDCTPGGPGSEACNVSSAGAQGLLDALNTIRESVQVSDTSTQTTTSSNTVTTTLPCEWDIPAPPAGQTFDKNLVNVTLTNAGSPQTIGNVSTEADCASADGGWYYDNADAPTRILACPATCDVIETLTEASVQVLIGCATEPAVLR